MNNLSFEIGRKSFHLLGIICPFVYYFIPKWFAILVLLIATTIIAYIDIYRHNNKQIQYIVENFLGKILRSEERWYNKLTGSTWMFLGLTISAIIFKKEITILSWLVLFISDALAALVGARFGKIKLIYGKTLEGSTVFFTTSLFIAILYNNIFNILEGENSIVVLILASLVSTLTELFAKKIYINDNLSIPISYGLILSFI